MLQSTGLQRVGHNLATEKTITLTRWTLVDKVMTLLFNMLSRLVTIQGGSDGKESACNAGDLGSIPGSGRSAGEGIGYPLQYLGFPSGSAGKESACNAGDLGSVPGLERSPEKRKAARSSILAWRIPWTV